MRTCPGTHGKGQVSARGNGRPAGRGARTSGKQCKASKREPRSAHGERGGQRWTIGSAAPACPLEEPGWKERLPLWGRREGAAEGSQTPQRSHRCPATASTASGPRSLAGSPTAHGGFLLQALQGHWKQPGFHPQAEAGRVVRLKPTAPRFPRRAFGALSGNRNPPARIDSTHLIPGTMQNKQNQVSVGNQGS